MKTNWWPIRFKHSCGLEGRILEFIVNSDGRIALTGLCVVCGDQFSEEYTMAQLFASCAIADFKQSLVEASPDALLEDFEPTGKPN